MGDLGLGRTDFLGPFGHFLFEFLFVASAGHHQAAAFQGVRDVDHQFVRLERLDDKSVRPQLQRAHGGGLVLHRGDHDHGQIGAARLDLLQQLHSGRAGHHDVEHHQGIARLLQHFPGRFAVLRLKTLIPFAAQHPRDDAADRLFVVHD